MNKQKTPRSRWFLLGGLILLWIILLAPGGDEASAEVEVAPVAAVAAADPDAGSLDVAGSRTSGSFRYTPPVALASLDQLQLLERIRTLTPGPNPMGDSPPELGTSQGFRLTSIIGEKAIINGTPCAVGDPIPHTNGILTSIAPRSVVINAQGQRMELRLERHR